MDNENILNWVEVGLTAVNILIVIVGLIIGGYQFKKKIERAKIELRSNTQTTFRKEWLNDFRNSALEYMDSIYCVMVDKDFTSFFSKQEKIRIYLNNLDSVDREIDSKLLEENQYIMGYRDFLHFNPRLLTVAEIQSNVLEEKDKLPNFYKYNGIENLVDEKIKDRVGKLFEIQRIYEDNDINGVYENQIDLENEFDQVLYDLKNDIYTKYLEQIKRLYFEIFDYLHAYCKLEWEVIKQEIAGEEQTEKIKKNKGNNAKIDRASRFYDILKKMKNE